MQRNINPNISKPKRNLFSNCVYQTNHEHRRTFESPGRTRRFIDRLANETINLEDNSTQTSKTILQLAQLESGSMSPDSLSPKVAPHIEDEPKFILDEGDHNCGSFSRKSHIMNYLQSCPNPTEEYVVTDEPVFPVKSLTETFLEKNRQKSKGTDTDTLYLNPSISSGGSSNICRSTFLQQTSPLRKVMEEKPMLRSKSYVEDINSYLPNYVRDFKPNEHRSRFRVKQVRDQSSSNHVFQPKLLLDLPDNTEKSSPLNSGKTRKANSFMSPTISSENKNQTSEIQILTNMLSPIRRGRSASPKTYSKVDNRRSKRIPYIDGSCSLIRAKRHESSDSRLMTQSSLFEKDLIKLDQLSLDLRNSGDECTTETPLDTISTTSTDCALFHAIGRLRDKDWNIALRGLGELVEICRVADVDVVYPHMTTVNQRVIELLRSPRSHVCRTACQAAGHLFQYIKDTRRPEFDEIVDNLLSRTADSNRFIRQDANLALDCMVTHMPPLHAVRSLCNKGPTHKNLLVRTATARLLVCVVVINGPENILHAGCETTRKRVIVNMVKFLEDKCSETRKFGERLYKQLYKETGFEAIIKKYLDKDEIVKMKRSLKSINKNR